MPSNSLALILSRSNPNGELGAYYSLLDSSSSFNKNYFDLLLESLVFLSFLIFKDKDFLKGDDNFEFMSTT